MILTLRRTKGFLNCATEDTAWYGRTDREENTHAERVQPTTEAEKVTEGMKMLEKKVEK